MSSDLSVEALRSLFAPPMCDRRLISRNHGVGCGLHPIACCMVCRELLCGPHVAAHKHFRKQLLAQTVREERECIAIADSVLATMYKRVGC